MAAVRREADALVVSLRAKGVNQALADALLTIFERGSRGGFHPSELLHDTLKLLCQRRTPPPLSSIKLPLRTKAEFVAALEHGSLDTALRSGVVALDKLRRAGTLDACSQAEAIGAEAELLACSVNATPPPSPSSQSCSETRRSLGRLRARLRLLRTRLQRRSASPAP